MREARIVGGEPATANAYPWAAHFSVPGFPTWCGGTLVDAQWVLSAAHCWDDGVRLVPASDITVTLGEHDLSRNEGTEQTRGVSEVVFHPDWNSGTLDSDVAMLRLDRPVTLNAQVGVAQIADAPAPGTNLVVIGWGRTTEGGRGATILQEVTVPRVADATCNANYAGLGGITGTMICAGFDMGARDACQGDSGGPLMTTGGGTRRIVGVVSWGQGCARPGLYGVYANAGLFRGWVNATMARTAEPTWANIAHANNVVAMASVDGRLFAATSDNRLWARDPVLSDISWTYIGHANNVTAMAGLNGRLYASTSDNRLWVRDAVLREVNWTHIGHANGVTAMAALNGRLYAATSSNFLYVRDPVHSDINWGFIGHANNVVAMGAANGRLYAATSDNRFWSREPVHSDVNWSLVGHANGVVGMTGLGDRLFAATNSNRLVTMRRD